MKKLYCANCGMELSVIRKAIPRLRTIVDLVESHDCERGPGTIDELEKLKDLVPINKPRQSQSEVDELFNSFKIVKNLNDLNTPASGLPGEASGDKRDKKFLREEVSSAPSGILSQIKVGAAPKPDVYGEGEEVSEDDESIRS
jgi:hypothetical protein